MSQLRATLSGLVLVGCIMALAAESMALGHAHYVDTVSSRDSFAIADKQTTAPIYVDANDYAGVVRAAGDLQSDIQRVTSRKPVIINATASLGASAIIVGTVGKSSLIDRLIADHKIDATPIVGKWESFLIQVVPKPFARRKECAGHRR